MAVNPSEVPSNPKLRKLALYGGEPVRKQWLPYSRQSLAEDDIQLVCEALRGDIITRGPFVSAFEEAVKDSVDMPEAVAFSSATAALHAVMALEKRKSALRVVVPAITFAATSNAVLYCDGEVTFADTENSTMNINPSALTQLSKTDVVMAVDFAGNPCRYDELKALQSEFGFRLIGDAAHSLGAEYKKKPLGSQADMTIFSFHPVKSITSGEGGMVVLRDREEAKFLRSFRAHGIVRTENPWFYRQEFLGFNYNITDIQCALGLSQLKRLPALIGQRREIAEAYREQLGAMNLIQLPQETAEARSAWHLFPVRIRFDQLNGDRDAFMKALHAENIGAQVHYIPVYWHPYYESLGFKRGLCPNAEAAYSSEISLPVFPGMKDQDIRDVCQALIKVLEAFSRI